MLMFKVSIKIMPEQQANSSDTSPAVISGGQPRRLPHYRRTILIVTVIVVAAAAASYAAYRVYNHYSQQQNQAAQLKQAAAALGDSYDYANFTPDQISLKLQAVGLSWDAARQGDLSKLNYEQAYTVARALRADHNYQRSLEAYKTAQAQAPSDVDYSFYKGYAEVALFANQTNVWKAEMTKQKQAILKDDNLNQDSKQTQVQKIDEAIRLKDLGW